HDILATEISPELVPAGEDGAIQSTESIVGPYALQDFNLFYATRYGFAPSKIAYLAWDAWHDPKRGVWPPNIPDSAQRAYGLSEIKSWLRVFLRRFFEQSQFKRSALSRRSSRRRATASCHGSRPCLSAASSRPPLRRGSRAASSNNCASYPRISTRSPDYCLARRRPTRSKPSIA